MGDEPREPFAVECPCCHATLRVDPALRAVLSHELPPEPKAVKSLTEAVKGLEAEAAQRQAKFEESLRAQKSKKDLLDKRFQDALKRSKDEPLTRPVRDIDLD
ncbi:MAG: hypothetical protein ACE147_10690 [Candidatus Methylomirabilales bacterium]